MASDKKLCPCNHREKKDRQYCSKHSRVKMVVMLRDAYKKNGQNSVVYYCYYKHNYKSDFDIIKGMLRRLQPRHHNEYTCILFYDQTYDKLIHREAA